MIINNNPCLNDKKFPEKKDKLIVNDLKVMDSLEIKNLPQQEKIKSENIIGFGAGGTIIPIDISDHATKWEDVGENAITPKGNKQIKTPIKSNPQISRMALGYDSNGIIIPIIAPEAIWEADGLVPTIIKPDNSIEEVHMPVVKADSLTVPEADIETLNVSDAASINTLKVLDLTQTEEIQRFNNAVVLAFAADGTIIPCRITPINTETTDGDLLIYNATEGQAVDSGKNINDLQLKLTPGYNISIDENYVISCDIKTMKFKGSVQTFADLPTDPEIGDVWNIKTTSENYCWDDTEWVIIGTSVDLSGYYTKEQTEQLVKSLIDDITPSTETAFSSTKVNGLIQDVKDYADGLVDETVHLEGSETINGTKTFKSAVFSGANAIVLPTTAGTVNGAIWIS